MRSCIFPWRTLSTENTELANELTERGEEDGYPWNPNGSMGNVAGICDDTGRIFGLMPHPERHVEQFHHPRWTRMKLCEEGEGLRIFKNAARFAETL